MMDFIHDDVVKGIGRKGMEDFIAGQGLYGRKQIGFVDVFGVARQKTRIGRVDADFDVAVAGAFDDELAVDDKEEAPGPQFHDIEGR